MQGVAPKGSKNTSVKKLIVIGAVADVQENYANVKVILDQLNIEALEFTMTADIKMCKFSYNYYNFVIISFLVMILTGKSPGKPSHGCPFCSARTPYLENGDLYKLGDLISLHQVSQQKPITKLIF